MSTFVPVTIRCGRCDGTFEGEAATGLHVSRTPEIRDRILDGSFHRRQCPYCGQDIVLHDRTFTYTDFDRMHWITVYPRDGLRYRTDLVRRALDAYDAVLRRQCPPFVTELWAEKFTIRVVFGLNALRERLVAWGDGLDDRRLEALKLVLIRDLRLGPFGAAMDLWYEGRDQGRLAFTHLGAPGPEGLRVARTFAVGPEAYVDLDPEAAKRAFPEVWDGPLVDWRTLVIPEEPLPDVYHNRESVGPI